MIFPGTESSYPRTPHSLKYSIHEEQMFCNPYSSSSIAGLRGFEVLPVFNVRNPPAPAVNSCKYYDCSYGYERKRDYRRITCKDECDDDQCCDKSGCSLVYDLTAMSTPLVVITNNM